MSEFTLSESKIQEYGDLIDKDKCGILVIRSYKDYLLVHYIYKFREYYESKAYIYDEFIVSSDYRHLRLVSTRNLLKKIDKNLHFGASLTLDRRFYFNPQYNNFYIESLPWWCVSKESGTKIISSWFSKVFQSIDTMIIVDLLNPKSVLLGLIKKSWETEEKQHYINAMSRDLIIDFWNLSEASFILKTLRRTKEKFISAIDIQDYIAFIKDCKKYWPKVLKCQELFETQREILESHLQRKILYHRCTRKKSP